jgi:hypothetical protein
MSHRRSTNCSSPENESVPTDVDAFVGKDELLKLFNDQLEQFDEWDRKRDWLAFHHHHYDWWMFPSE